MMSELYEELYLRLFNAVTDGLEAISNRNYGQAEDILKAAQQRAEERYIQAETPT